MDRRGFIRGASLTALGLAGASFLGGCASGAQDGGGLTYDQTIAWDGEYDVVVIGFGGAGAVAAKTAAEAGASVLVAEKAPKEFIGGNTRMCSQMFAYGSGDVEATKAYYRALCAEFTIPDDVFDVYTEGIANITDMYAESYGLDKNEFSIMPYPGEYPELEGSDKVHTGTLHEGSADAYMWTVQQKAVENLSDKIDVWLESPATKLLQDPQSRAILGATIERDGKQLNIRAHNGVVLACGGFENNREMVRDYLGIGNHVALGTPYNTGDGVKMASAVGADLWHMSSVETMHIFGGLSYKVEDGMQGQMVTYSSGFMAGSIILVGTDGYRYLREDELPRHGHVYGNGSYHIVKHPARSFLVFDQAQMDEVRSIGEAPEAFLEQAASADSLAELGQAIGAKEGALEQTVADFNEYAAAGRDPQYLRAAESMRAFGSGPYYALELMPDILNTQGGPRRNGSAEVIDTFGNPIPHLYAAGECGGVASNMYQGGGNMADNLIFDQIAGRNAAAAKDPLPSYSVATANSKMTYTIGAESDL